MKEAVVINMMDNAFAADSSMAATEMTSGYEALSPETIGQLRNLIEKLKTKLETEPDCGNQFSEELLKTSIPEEDENFVIAFDGEKMSLRNPSIIHSIYPYIDANEGVDYDVEPYGDMYLHCGRYCKWMAEELEEINREFPESPDTPFDEFMGFFCHKAMQLLQMMACCDQDYFEGYITVNEYGK